MPRTVLAGLTLACAASAASAHQGPHLHPHGAELPVGAMLAAGALGLVVWLALRGRSR
jgi:hypothetical protein